jgi:DNA-binding transcriptional LysR family regulator
MYKCMDWRSINFDWNHARAFLVTAEEGSLTAAAQALAMTQPTLGRQVAALEKELGVALFERVGKGLALTPSGLELLEHVRAMGESAANLSLLASGQSTSIEGNVCISTTDLVATLVMPDLVSRLRHRYPGISLELVASNSESDLKRREADIALRGYQPTQPDLIAKRIGEVTAHLYASSGYLQTLDKPISLESLSSADFICDKPEAVINLLKGCGVALTPGNFPVVSESVVTQWELIKKGMGLALLPDQLAVNEPQFQQVLPELQPYKGLLWLVVHRELRTNRRVRVVFDFLAEELSRLLG